MQPVPHAARRAANAIAIAALACLTLTLPATAHGAFRDQQGADFSFAGLRGAPVIVTFVATHCEDACPLINAQFAAMQRQLARSGLRVHLVTLSLDPAHDSPRDMRALSRTFAADARYWSVVWGPQQQTRALLTRFGVVSHEGQRGYNDLHTTYVYVLDRRGRLEKTLLAGSNLTADLYAELQRSWNRLTT